MQDCFNLFLEIHGNSRPQAIVNKNVMSLFQKISGDGKESLRNQAIGDIGDIAMTGKPVKSPRVHKNYSFFYGNYLLHEPSVMKMLSGVKRIMLRVRLSLHSSRQFPA
jgi:hypothetical protein